LQIVQPPPPTEQRVRIVPIIRDVAIVWVLTAIGGFVAGFATGGSAESNPGRALAAIVVSNFLLGTVAFTIAGCLAPPPRWRHLCFVALGAWLTSLINVVFFKVTIAQWFSGIMFMGIIMAIGGGLSYLFKRDTK
jgi:hypothetical protein